MHIDRSCRECLGREIVGACDYEMRGVICIVLGDIFNVLLFFICLFQRNVGEDEYEQRIRHLEKQINDLEAR